MDVIIPHTSKLRSLTIELMDINDTIQQWLATHSFISTPLLEEVSFADTYIPTHTNVNTSPTPWPFRDVLNLPTLNVGLFNFDLGMVGEQLVDLEGKVDDNWFEMLSHCPRLQRLSLDFIQPPREVLRRESIELRSLVELNIRNPDTMRIHWTVFPPTFSPICIDFLLKL